MNISGLQKTTLLDYPNHVAATIFLSGCNMRCPFCHNMNLVMSDSCESYTPEDILSFLSKRKGILDGVCITGGEPTLYPDLPDFIRSIKSLNLAVKLDTNGTNPNMLSSLMEEGLIDYVAMDIKSSPDTYGTVCGVSDISLDNIYASVGILLSSNISYEFRTTVVAEYHTASVMHDIGRMLKGADKYYLQSFTDSEYVPNHNLSPVSSDTLISYQTILSDYINQVYIRGVDI